MLAHLNASLHHNIMSAILQICHPSSPMNGMPCQKENLADVAPINKRLACFQRPCPLHFLPTRKCLQIFVYKDVETFLRDRCLPFPPNISWPLGPPLPTPKPAPRNR